jgi:lipopolysaccharide export system protein LptA
MKIFRYLFICILCPFIGFSQKASKVEVINADVFEFVKSNGEQTKKLKGNCQFKQDNTYFYCDSALLYDVRNAVDAYGKVRIVQGDSLQLFGDFLNYDGNTKIAYFNKNVKVIHNEMVLTTQVLTYDTKNKIATYPQGGKIVNVDNILTSTFGYYYANTADAYFKKNVVLTNPKYLLKSDTLKYNSKTRIATFYGPTTITSEEDFLYSEAGTYNTVTDIAQFTKNPYYKNGSQTLAGDFLYYDRVKGLGRASKNISFVDTAQKIILKGNKANYNKKTESSVVTDKAYVIVLVDNDSLFLSADTLKSFMDKTMTHRTLIAYHDVMAYKTDLQARCDSMVYTYIDSTMRCYTNPTIWSQNAQMTADFITLELKNGDLHKMNLYNNSFLVMVDSLDTLKFDQIRGKNMFGFFVNNELQVLNVEGNGESIYYAKEDDKPGEYLGVNKAECSNMSIRFKDNKVQKVNFLVKPDAVFSPLDKVEKEELTLKGFTWRIQLQPKSKQYVIDRIKSLPKKSSN